MRLFRRESLAQLLTDVDALAIRMGALEAQVAEFQDAVLRLERFRTVDAHDVRRAAARSDVVARQARELRTDLEGRLERIAARSSAESHERDERAFEHLRHLSARIDAVESSLRSLASGGGRTRLVGGSLDDAERSVGRQPHLVRGWAICEPSPVSSIEIFADGIPLSDVRFALPRPDIEHSFSSTDAPVCGFDAFLDLTGREPGTEIIVEAQAVALDRSRFSLGRARFRIEGKRRSTALDKKRVDELRGRFESRLPQNFKRARDGLRLMVFTHSLDYGGAELRLFEFLRGVARSTDFSAVLISPREGPLQAELEELGIPVHITQGFGVGSIEAYEGKQQELVSWLAQHDVNVALAVTLAAFPGVDLAGRLDIPCVWSVHETLPVPLFLSFGFPFEASVHPYAAERAEEALRAASAVLFVADASRRVYERYGDGERFLVVPSGIDLEAIKAHREAVDRLAARASRSVDPEATVVLCVGILQPKKAQTLLVQAMREVVSRHPRVVCVLVGDSGGPYAAALAELVARAGLGERVRIVPTARNVWDWLAAADVFVSPSFEETLPVAILEAMAFELPILATDTGAISELVDDGVSGFLCKSADLGALVEGLERLLAAPAEQRRALTDEAHARVRQRHDVRESNRRIESLLRSMSRDGALAVVSSARANEKGEG